MVTSILIGVEGASKCLCISYLYHKYNHCKALFGILSDLCSTSPIRERLVIPGQSVTKE